MIAISHPTANANVRGLLTALHDEGLLWRFYTTIAYRDSGWSEILPTSVRMELARRSFPEIPEALIKTHSRRELLRLISARISVPFGAKFRSVSEMYREFDRWVSRQTLDTRVRGVYCYEDGAVQTFKAVKRENLRCYYDLPIGYWRSLREVSFEEQDLSPEWADSMPSLREPAWKLAAKDEELYLADRIFVASSFTRRTLESAPTVPIAPITIIPYGAPEAIEPNERTYRMETSVPLRVLYVGSLSQRKGLSYLKDAVDATENVTLTIVGRPGEIFPLPIQEFCRRHKWIESAPHDKVLALMRNHDVLVFPSLFEGYGLVVTEALSQGLPVITTTNTCGPDVLTDGVEGWIVPIRTPQAIAARLAKLRDSPELCLSMSEAALSRARQLRWADYGTRVCNQLSLDLAKAN